MDEIFVSEPSEEEKPEEKEEEKKEDSKEPKGAVIFQPSSYMLRSSHGFACLSSCLTLSLKLHDFFSYAIFAFSLLFFFTDYIFSQRLG